MTVDRAAVLDALRAASAEGFATAKEVAASMGIKGSSPLVRSVRKELVVLARQGRVETEVHPAIGRRYRYVEEPSGVAGIVARMERRAAAEDGGVLPEEEPEEVEEEGSEVEPEPEEDDEDEPGPEDDDGPEERPRLVRRSLPTATHRVLKVLSDGRARTLKELKGYGVSSTTLKPMRDEGLVYSAEDGYHVTDDGLRGLSEIEEDWPELRGMEYAYEEYVEFEKPRPKGRMPTTVHAMLCALADGRPRRAKDLMAAGIGEKTHGTVYQRGWCERTGLGYAITDAGRARLDEIERDWPELRAKGRDVPVPATEEKEQAPKAEPEPEPVQKVEQLPGYDGPDPLPDDPPMTEAENAVVVDMTTVYRLTLRTPSGRTVVDVPACDEEVITGVLGHMRTMCDAVGRAVRVRTVAGEVQIGHIVDDTWRFTR